MEYNDLLKRAKDNLPDIVSVRDRFEIPKVTGRQQGNKTQITNFSQICSTLHRDCSHLQKYLLKELATSGDFTNNVLNFNRKVSSTDTNEKIRQYVNKFVLCYECGKPDTKIILENGISYLKCQACGAKKLVR
jgi:translation initiation factor 2 subunit 2